MFSSTILRLVILAYLMHEKILTNVEAQSNDTSETEILESEVRYMNSVFNFTKIQEEVKNQTKFPRIQSKDRSLFDFSVTIDAYQNLGPAEIIKLNGYAVEEHTVTTQDGFLIDVFRIASGKRKSVVRKTPVLMMPGAFTGCDSWLVVSPERALPFVLVNEGYDVWLGNFRGNDFGKRHVSYSQNQLEFWMHGLEELGTLDIPALIDYILDETQEKQLHFIGFSIATTAVISGLSLMPEYNAKIKQMVLLAPVGYFYHTESAFKYLSIIPDQMFLNVFDILGHGRFCFREVNLLSRLLLPETCNTNLLPTITCGRYLANLFGFGVPEPNRTTELRATNRFPHEVSARLMLQVMQLVRHNSFRRLDYGPDENIERYGTPFPPDYELNKVVVPTLGFYGPNDILVKPIDARRTFSELGNCVNLNSSMVNYTPFAHNDFLGNDGVKYLVYDRIVDFFNNYFVG